MKQRMGVEISRDRQIKGGKNELVIIAPANGNRDDTFVLQVENSA
jgi:hypothetical protein